MKIKKIMILFVCTIMLISAVSCGKNEDAAGNITVSDLNDVQAVPGQAISEPEPETETAAEPEPETEPVPETLADTSSGITGDYVDLTVLSATMVYAEVYNMMYYPEDYIGRTVKMSGIYSVYHDESTDKYYHACIIQDATACCSQGIEFELTDDYSYPSDYPEEGGQICVEGVFDIYHEGESAYCTLREAKMSE